MQVDDFVNGGRTLAVNVEHLKFADTDAWLGASNAIPVVWGDVVASVTEGTGMLVVDALTNASDADAGSLLTVTGLPILPEGVSFDTVSQSFVVDGNAAAFDSLAAGEQLALRINYAVTDGMAVMAASALVTLIGSNDTAQISGVQSERGRCLRWYPNRNRTTCHCGCGSWRGELCGRYCRRQLWSAELERSRGVELCAEQ